jgi:hypothetical protein
MHDSIQKPRKTDPGASTSTKGETAPHADGHNEHECPVSQSIPQLELEVVDQGDTAKTKSPRSKTPTLGDLATGNGSFSANPKIASLQRLYRKFLTVQQDAVAAAAPTVFQAGEELIALKNTECGKYGKWLPTLAEIGIPQSTAKDWVSLVTRRNDLLSQGKTLPEAYQLLGLTPLGLRKPRKTAISKPVLTLDAALNFLAGWRAKLKKSLTPSDFEKLCCCVLEQFSEARGIETRDIVINPEPASPVASEPDQKQPEIEDRDNKPAPRDPCEVAFVVDLCRKHQHDTDVRDEAYENSGMVIDIGEVKAIRANMDPITAITNRELSPGDAERAAAIRVKIKSYSFADYRKRLAREGLSHITREQARSIYDSVKHTGSKRG